MLRSKSFLAYGLITGASFLLLLSGWSMGFSGSRQYLNLSDVSIATVTTGEFSQKVTGYGVLQSKDQRLLTATSMGIVDEIRLRPGAEVASDSVILTIKNPELEVALQQSMTNLNSAKTELRKLQFEQRREQLSQESQLSKLMSESEMAQLLVEAQESLSETGVVSGIEVKKTRLQAKHLERQLLLEQERLEQLTEVHKEQVQIKEEEIEQALKAWLSAKQQLEQMVVRAGIDGILQRLPVNLGQSVAIGDELALVGSKDGLIAEIKVPQLQANLVRIGSTAEIDTRHGLVDGQVVRIDPVVENGAVKVDIQLPEQLSDAIRPMQTVDAIIFGQNRSNISSVQKPLGVSKDMSLDVFKLIANNTAQRIKVQFGQVSNNNIEVISGLRAGEKIIVSSPDIDADVEIVKLVN